MRSGATQAQLDIESVNTNMTALIRIVTLGAVAATLMAQRPGPRAAAGSLDPATAAQNQVTRLTMLLDLTSAQAAQALTIFTNSFTATSSLQATLDLDRKTLDTAITTNALSVIDQVAANIGTLQGKITAIQSKASAAVYAILTSAQQTKATQFGGVGVLGGSGGPGGFPGPGRFPGPGGRGAGRP